MLRVADKRSILPTLPPRLAALVGPEARLLLAGGIIVVGGLACCYAVWRRRGRSYGRFASPIAGDVDDASILRNQEISDYEGEIDEALDDSFPASDPPSFNARGIGDTHNLYRNGTTRTQP